MRNTVKCPVLLGLKSYCWAMCWVLCLLPLSVIYPSLWTICPNHFLLCPANFWLGFWLVSWEPLEETRRYKEQEVRMWILFLYLFLRVEGKQRKSEEVEENNYNNRNNLTKVLFKWRVQGFELRALYLVGRCFTTEAMPPALFTLVILDMGSRFLPKPAWTRILLYYASHLAWDNRHTPLCPPIGWDGVSWSLCLGWAWIAILWISGSQVTRIIDMSHLHQARKGTLGINLLSIFQNFQKVSTSNLLNKPAWGNIPDHF
jgi:hypothetical protein